MNIEVDQSHEHPNLHVRTLDWFDAADAERCPPVQALFDEAQPDIILGTDVVSNHPLSRILDI